MFCPLGLKAGKACDPEYGYNIHHVDLGKLFYVFTDNTGHKVYEH